MKAQWEKRLDLTIVIYQYLLLRLSREEVFNVAIEEFNLDADSMRILETLIDDENKIVDRVKPFLKPTWPWERMSYFDRAIILESILESDILNTPKPIIIDQALITARKYNIDDSYKYINAILEKVITCKNTL